MCTDVPRGQLACMYIAFISHIHNRWKGNPLLFTWVAARNPSQVREKTSKRCDLLIRSSPLYSCTLTPRARIRSDEFIISPRARALSCCRVLDLRPSSARIDGRTRVSVEMTRAPLRRAPDALVTSPCARPGARCASWAEVNWTAPWHKNTQLEWRGSDENEWLTFSWSPATTSTSRHQLDFSANVRETILHILKERFRVKSLCSG